VLNDHLSPSPSPLPPPPPPPPHTHLFPRGNLNASVLEAEEGGYIYRYAYNGVGEGVTWLSSRNYLVIDLAAGPTTYGPLVRQGGAATPQGIPSIKVREEGRGGCLNGGELGGGGVRAKVCVGGGEQTGRMVGLCVESGGIERA